MKYTMTNMTTSSMATTTETPEMDIINAMLLPDPLPVVVFSTVVEGTRVLVIKLDKSENGNESETIDNEPVLLLLMVSSIEGKVA